jgi:hypothetical protein
MTTVYGRVTAGTRGISNVLVEVFDAPSGFDRCIPLESRKHLARQHLKRLGSATTNSSGEFEVTHQHGDEKKRWYQSHRPVNLWVTVSACCEGADSNRFIYQADIVRECAAEHEEYLICLDAQYEDVNNPLAAAEDSQSPDVIEAEFETQQKIGEARRSVARKKVQAREVLQKDFQDNIVSGLKSRMSLVERNGDGTAIDPYFVDNDEPVRRKAELRTAEEMNKDLVTSLAREDRFSLKGRILLTDAQVTALKAKKRDDVSTDDAFAVSEDDVVEALESDDGSGANPEADTQIVNRVDAIKRYCLDFTKTDECLSDLMPGGDDGHDHGDGPVVNGNGDGPIVNGDHDADADDDDGDVDDDGDGDGDGDRGIEEPNAEDRTDRTGRNVTLEQLKDELPSYMASVLDEQSALDPGGAELPAPGSRLDEAGIASANAFPSLTLPPGPADVPAFYDFYDLQIAFGPVWQEALDDSIFGDVEKLYERYVESGGTAGNFLDAVFNFSNVVWTQWLSAPIDTAVQKHVEISNKEWEALTVDQQNELSAIAAKIEERLGFLYRPKLQGNKFTDGLTGDDLKTFNRTKEYVMTHVGELREQAERIVAAARKELERQAAGKSIVPDNAILKQLRSRLTSSYPAKYFAANRQQRSVNFGLMLTYRQRWTPTAYQVGELIKSIPMAPKEVRKYSKKVVRKKRRSKKEIENNIESLKSETDSKTRAEADIVQDATDKTNFNASANGSFSVGVWSGGGSTSLTQDASSRSAETKKRMHEAVVKAAREYRNEIKVELSTEESFEEEFQESGEIMNPNDELTVTYLFYELQRRYRVEERLHRMMSVVLVAQEMPNPSEIDDDWLIAHRWIINRVLLDDAFKQPLYYVAEGLVAEQFALEEARKSLEQQRRLVEELKEDVSTTRVMTESRYAALQRSMERSARATQRKSKGGGLFGFAKKLTSYGVVGDLVDRFIPGEDESPEAARVREAAAQDAYQREMQKLRELEGQLAQQNASLSRATEEFSDRLGAHLANVVQVTELKNHIKDNITHYMQAIWMHEPFQQRWMRLKDVPVPKIKRDANVSRIYRIREDAIKGALTNVTHLGAKTHDYEVWPELPPPKNNPQNEPELETVPLYQVADIDDLIGFRANYMIFPMKEANAITDFMMEPYVERAAGGFGMTDPDELGNMNLDDFSEYVCCLKEHLSDEQFQELTPELKAQLKKLLQSPLRDDEEIVVPMDAMYIEALPGSRPILEDFKLLHRQIDAADAQEDLRLKKMEKIRYAQRLLEGRTDDPESDARYEFTGNPDMDFAITPPSGGGGSGGGGS